MYTIPMFNAVLEKNSASKYMIDIPAHEIPMMLTRWSSERFLVGEQTEDTFAVTEFAEELERLLDHYGRDLLQRTYGVEFPESVKKSLDKLSIPKRKVDGENASKSKDRTSTATGV